ncbi:MULTISPECIES: heme-degrading domain-containing protein [Rhizobium]|nr:MULTISPECIES: heme-degrading domain-containing protein [Rhizobium]ANK95462.1 hypothetical protein AMK01_PD00583 [Rhizobium sp. N6212]ANL01515.1 hypothetical protein AMK00_PD00582 [Rhizobium sp. N621]ANL07643.1 hypothetical protein AMJ99_PD00589 [Rhizobium esperanzae]ANL13813.1 hypothetical protein AMJ98_PE00589 [Rhizobium sp. N1341]ANL25799.1 hypothetical protein AMJ96_PD00598 [Rhizobium sp. N113]
MTIDEQIAVLETELLEIQLPHFDAGVAWRIGAFIHERADTAGKRIACEISRPGQQLFYFAMPGIAPDSEAWIRRKRNVVERFHKSSLLMKLLADKQERPLLERYALAPGDYCASGGGVPIVVKGSGCLGAVTVSGLTQFDDHALGVEALRNVLSTL